MGPSDVQELLDFEPFTPLRITLASGHMIEVRQREGVNVTGASMSILDTTIHGQPRFRLVSVVNMVLIEPIFEGPTNRRVTESET